MKLNGNRICQFKKIAFLVLATGISYSTVYAQRMGESGSKPVDPVVEQIVNEFHIDRACAKLFT